MASSRALAVSGTGYQSLNAFKTSNEIPSQGRELVLLVNQDVAHATGIRDRRTVGIRVGGRGSIVLRRLNRVLELHVVDEPREVLGLALGELDRQAGGEATVGPCHPTDGRGSAGRLHVWNGGPQGDDPNFCEQRLADNSRRTRRLNATRREEGDRAGGDHGDVVAERDVSSHTLLLTGRDCNRDVTLRQRQVCGRVASRD